MLAPNSENGSNNKTNNFVFAPEVPMHGNNTQFRPSGSDFLFSLAVPLGTQLLGAGG
jgi:hypothetical protein